MVSAASTPKLGRVIVDSKGFTLYDFHKDKGTTSSCYGGCAQVWPPLLSEGKPQAGEGAVASKLGTTKRKDGTAQVTYAGHPLYTYVTDTKPGDTTGNGFSSFGARGTRCSPAAKTPAARPGSAGGATPRRRLRDEGLRGTSPRRPAGDRW